MKHIDLDTQDEHVKQFVLSQELGPEGSVLELHGKPVARLLPPPGNGTSYDRERLKAAILARRDESRRLNEDWQHVDQEVWEKLPSDEA